MTTTTNSPLRYVIPALAAAVLAFAGYSVGKSNSGTSSASTQFAPAGQTQTPAGQTQTPQAGQAPPGFGTAVTGAAAAKAKAAALAKYSGSVEGVVQLSDGSYVVHVITSSGEVHVAVSKAFTVTGVDQGPGGAPPQGTTTPQAGATTS